MLNALAQAQADKVAAQSRSGQAGQQLSERQPAKVA